MLKGKRIAVYCSSARDPEPASQKAASAFGTRLGREGCTLVFGGTATGLMKLLADAALASGAPVYASIPKQFQDKAFQGCTELHVAADLRERKARMESWADAMVCLPGGFGTLDELAETLAQQRLGVHHKPLVLLNLNGFYEPFSLFVDRMIADGHAPESSRSLFYLAPNVEAVFEHLEQRWA